MDYSQNANEISLRSLPNSQRENIGGKVKKIIEGKKTFEIKNVDDRNLQIKPFVSDAVVEIDPKFVHFAIFDGDES